ncbi:Zinc finger RAD18 domain-containing protein [Aphelenchoides avenae]|nr:Zinc finger RAD18 domain-containing protein [Aphelenchus avenae]
MSVLTDHNRPSTSRGGKKDDEPPRKLNLVDPSYELIDPTPDLHSTFVQFNTQFFDGALAACTVEWSKRMTACAGICYFQPKSGLCSIRLSEPLLKLRPRKDFIDTLLHEMIHAYLFILQRNQDRDGHGPEFQRHMHRINAAAGTNITIYHSFHDEVAECRQHWWVCNGECRHRPPYFGVVKRAMNRAPSKNDIWWEAHRQSCGGVFTKVKEPADFGKKKLRWDSAKKKTVVVEDDAQTTLDRFFTKGDPADPANGGLDDAQGSTRVATLNGFIGAGPTSQVSPFTGEGHRLGTVGQHSSASSSAAARKWEVEIDGEVIVLEDEPAVPRTREIEIDGEVIVLDDEPATPQRWEVELDGEVIVLEDVPARGPEPANDVVILDESD